ncbi:MAG TPA: hypothetical protein VF692_07420 [Pyrinomonadaceae bacterium]
MKQPPSGVWLNLSAWVYKSLLFTLPKEFRRNYAAEMTLVFRDCCRDANSRAGFYGVIGELSSGVLDLIVNAVKERILILITDKFDQSFFLATAVLAVTAGIFAAFADLRNTDTETPLLLVLIFSFALGFVHPRVFWLSGLLIGLMMPAIHFIALVRGWRVEYPNDSSTPLWAFLTLLPALTSSLTGAGFRLILKIIWRRLD